MLEDKVNERKQCNYRDKCMVDGNCLLIDVTYRTTVITPEKSKQYVESSGLLFKSRYLRHECSFNNSKYRLKYTLSKYTLELKEFKTWLYFLQYEKTRDVKIKPEFSLE